MKDHHGLNISTDSPDILNLVEKFKTDLLSMGKGVVDILPLADNYPESLLIQTYSVCVYLYGQTKESDLKAHKYLIRAKDSIAEANDREKLFFSAVESWSEGKLQETANKLEQLLRQWPRDLVAAKVLEFIYYMLGQQHSGKRFLNTMESIYEDNKNSGYYFSSYSFALELCGNYEKARTAAERAVELVEINPWAHHTLSHVFIKSGNLDYGTKILEDYQYVWDHSGQAINSHNYWHLALMHLENHEVEKAYTFLDNHILGDKPYLVIQKLDAISLLWRLEMAGFNISEHIWKSIADEIKENAKDCYIAYISAHYIYALARAGMEHELAEALRSVKSNVEGIDGPEKEVWEKVGLPLIDATASYALDKYKPAADILAQIIDDVEMVGGSDAQVDLFRQAYLLSLINCNKKSEAKKYLNNLSTSPTLTPLQNYWLSLIN